MVNGNGKRLVIVESPAKARTLSHILGRDYQVLASVGHVRDLPKSRLGVNVADDFAPHYIVPKEKRQIVKEIQAAAQRATAVFLATDPDREGEAISWHLVEAADLGSLRRHRVTFHEITPQAVRQAFEQPREIDMQMVYAQQARRILDRLVGYEISPLLWRKVHRGLSAGRVQSVALRLVVEREREIEGFVPQEYWTIQADVARTADPDSAAFRAKLVGVGDAGKKPDIASEDAARRIAAELAASTYRLAAFKKSEQRRRPQPPFITSTLQQEASRRLGFTPKRTMALAQQLYEGLPLGAEGAVGLITYMRTDSTQVAESAVAETRAFIRRKFGKEYLPAAPRAYRRKVKGAQEAHEAIRPTSTQREPEQVRRYLTPDQYRLYTLIWQRMVASQMTDAVYDVTTADIEALAATGSSHSRYLLRATTTVLRFAGFRRLYVETAEDDTQPDDALALPELTPGEALRLLQVIPEQHFTEPQPRYSEATLVKALEENGIGRPSTYAPILSTLQERGYVERVSGRLRPKELGRVVNDLLTTHFPDIIDVTFTAAMEEELDDIASGQKVWQQVVRDFYGPLARALAAAEKASPVQEPTAETCDQCGQPMVVRWGRYGRFLACSGFPECRNSRPLEGEEAAPETDERCDQCDAPMVVKRGRFGRFLACSRYPECKGTRPLLNKTGARCPKCQAGDLVERRSHRRRVFYGCSRYPECDFTSWARPQATPCPQCSGLLVAEERQGGRCTRCDWRGEPAQPEPIPATSSHE